MRAKIIKNMKMKTYVLSLSKNFPATHIRKGEPTGFREKVVQKIKLHTLRQNYELWEHRFNIINSGNAVLSVREWIGAPRKSKQVEVFRFTKEDGIGLQKLEATALGWFIDNKDSEHTSRTFAKNDGLSHADFKEWFKDVDLSEPLAIIHFTKFRY